MNQTRKIILACSLGLLMSLIAAVDTLPYSLKLVREQTPVSARITDVLPWDDSIAYEYTVEHIRYEGGGSKPSNSLKKIGDQITVFYVRSNPAESSYEKPENVLNNNLCGVFVTFLFFTVFGRLAIWYHVQARSFVRRLIGSRIKRIL